MPVVGFMPMTLCECVSGSLGVLVRNNAEQRDNRHYHKTQSSQNYDRPLGRLLGLQVEGSNTINLLEHLWREYDLV